MARTPRTVEDAIARFDAYSARLDGHTPAASAARRRHMGRSAATVGRRLANIGMALVALIVATMAWGLFVSPIGWSGLFIAAIATLFILVFFSVWGGEKPEKSFNEQMPNRDVVRTLDGFLHRRRPALPAPAARRVDAISQQLPLLESRLGEVDALDPLAQDARRLMGKHLPELIERYERVPAPYRHQRDAEGMTVDERLAASLDAANQALAEIGQKLAKTDMDAFETQGRFIESRYSDKDGIKSE
ncbi:MAG TPA: hypothetical protein VGD10_02405 [Allosphingosinicella sp.]|uniref:hypothetical protein n=1 Tax=Allosphingosinicella sp. TaxID=2823234 RepID=UPI002EDAA9FF